MDSPWRSPQSSDHSSARRSGPVRRAMVLANLNAGLWAVGNGLVSTMLVIFLAMELGAAGLAVSWILAAPRFVGLLRLGTPALIARFGDRKKFCLVGFLLSGLVLWAMPFLAAPGGWVATSGSLGALIVCWSVYHLLEYMATIALWSWLGDSMPSRVRGRLVGRREQWLVLGRVVGIGASVTLSVGWSYVAPDAPAWEPLAWSATVGAPVMMLAMLPLFFLPQLARRPSASPRTPWRSTLSALRDPAYGRLVVYSCWLALANGITGAAQNMYPRYVLGMSYHHLVGLRSIMFTGQSLLAPEVGRWVDRWGARRTMIASQMVVATGPIFFWLATPSQRWWVAGAYFVWIAYAGLNVGLDSLKLQLAPGDNNAPHLAVYHAVSDLANGGTLLAAGLFLEYLRDDDTAALQLYAMLFLVGFLARLLATFFVWRIREP